MSAPTGSENARKQTARRHLEQLKTLFPSGQMPPGVFPDPNIKGILFSLLQQWTEANIGHIQNAVKNRAFGNGSTTINWENAFLAFMESMAMYLRDFPGLLGALEVYKEATATFPPDLGKLEHALDLHAQSTAEIQQLAESWGMTYVQICDLSTTAPVGQPTWDGPYCGIFCSIDPAAPFMGLSFKGTFPGNWAEDLVDYNYEPIVASNLFNTSVSKGVHSSLFDEYESLSQTAWQYIQELMGVNALEIPNEQAQDVITHITGHSLGASYACFAYAQGLSEATASTPSLPKLMSLGDMYTFGQPRLGEEDWAIQYKAHVAQNPTQGQSWRIANYGDLVPTVPPTSLKPYPPYFYHVDNGIHIFTDKAPEPIPTEINQTPPPPPVTLPKDPVALIKLLLGVGKHLPNAYYASMKEALQTAGPSSIGTTTNGRANGTATNGNGTAH